VFVNRVLRRIFGPNTDEVTGEQRKLHNEELHNLYSSPGIFRMMKSRKMRWVGHVVRMRRRGMHMACWWKRQEERDIGRPRCRWVDNIKFILEELDGAVWAEFILIRIGIGEGLFRTGNEPSGSKKCWEILEWLCNWLHEGLFDRKVAAPV
jgi:hypothetical protein